MSSHVSNSTPGQHSPSFADRSLANHFLDDSFLDDDAVDDFHFGDYKLLDISMPHNTIQQPASSSLSVRSAVERSSPTKVKEEDSKLNRFSFFTEEDWNWLQDAHNATPTKLIQKNLTLESPQKKQKPSPSHTNNINISSSPMSSSSANTSLIASPPTTKVQPTTFQNNNANEGVTLLHPKCLVYQNFDFLNRFFTFFWKFCFR